MARKKAVPDGKGGWKVEIRKTDPNDPTVGQPPVAEMSNEQLVRIYANQYLQYCVLQVDPEPYKQAEAELLRRLAQSRSAPADAGMVDRVMDAFKKSIRTALAQTETS